MPHPGRQAEERKNRHGQLSPDLTAGAQLSMSVFIEGGEIQGGKSSNVQGLPRKFCGIHIFLAMGKKRTSSLLKIQINFN